MMDSKGKRIEYMYIFVLLICILIIGRVIYLNILNFNKYNTISKNSIYKDIKILAPRGEILDRNGVLLAGNRPVFVVSISKNEIESGINNYKDRMKKLNDVSEKISKILIENNEKIEDNFPIKIENGNYYFTFDKEIENFLKDNGLDENISPKDAFYKILDNYNLNSENKIDKNKNVYDIQIELNKNGVYPPISIKKGFHFQKKIEKEEFLAGFDIKDEKITAKEAFSKIRENRCINKNLTDDEARNILVIVNNMLSKKYLQYEPVIISKNISKKTVSLINENLVNLKGVLVNAVPVRYYPQGELACHILGQIGKISENDKDILKDKRYSNEDYVGKSGIELVFEKELKGTNGYERVLVNSMGKKIKDIEYKDSKSGNNVYLSIDAKLQKVAEDSLKKTLTCLQNGTTYESKWGNYNMGLTRTYKNANAGACVVLDVKTGKVLALASYPNYDPNMFTRPITKSEMEKLQPPNKNDPLSPKPLFNYATMTAVQPGSIFKMITALAALEKGLDPYYEIEDKGYIDIGGKIFGNWLWNLNRKTQGFENVITALRDSNNYYFFSVATGYNYATNKKIPMGDMENGMAIIDEAKKFGLNKKTGIEIYEISGQVPDPENKYIQHKKMLNEDILNKMKNKFEDIDENSPLYQKRINEIVSWIDENPERYEIIERLKNLNVKEDSLEEIADLLKYTYFLRAKWTTGDIFNIAIGQGEHQYTPIAMANYISAIANNGYLNNVSVVDKISNKKNKIERFNNPSSTRLELNNHFNLEYLRKGMIDVTDEGTAKEIFKDFPIKVAAKTGTAETQGKIPTKDEVSYYLNHIPYYNLGIYNKYDVLNLANKLEKESKYKYRKEHFIKLAIMKLNPKLTIDDLDRFKETYADFSWFASFAPYDNPEIAVVTMLVQGGSGGHAGPLTRDVIAQYMGLNKEEVLLRDENENNLIVDEKTTKDFKEEKEYDFGTYVEKINPLNQSYENTYEPSYEPEYNSLPENISEPKDNVVVNESEDPLINENNEIETKDTPVEQNNEKENQNTGTIESTGIIYSKEENYFQDKSEDENKTQ